MKSNKNAISKEMKNISKKKLFRWNLRKDIKIFKSNFSYFLNFEELILSQKKNVKSFKLQSFFWSANLKIKRFPSVWNFKRFNRTTFWRPSNNFDQNYRTKFKQKIIRRVSLNKLVVKLHTYLLSNTRGGVSVRFQNIGWSFLGCELEVSGCSKW